MSKARNDLPSTESRGDVEVSQMKITKPQEHVGYVSRKVDVKMTHDQATKFRSILRQLEDSDKQLKDGSPVNNKRRAVLWLIENYEPV